MANNTFQAVNTIGFPEARIILSQCVIYLATSPKSNSAYIAINKAQALVKETGDLQVPLALRNAPTKLMKELNYGTTYKYAHDYQNNFVEMEFMPSEIQSTSLFEPGNNLKEQQIKKRIQEQWKGKY
jgi:putative ATPase